MTEDKIKKDIGIILLAAGKSSRIGRPKQLLLYDNLPLLQHSLKVAADSHAHPVIVVLGAHAEAIKKEIDSGDAYIIENAEWPEGMASSIRTGVHTLLKTSPAVSGLIIMVCDQPYVTSSLLDNLMEVHGNTDKAIIACGYGGTFGPPVLFNKSIFPELLLLKGDAGAKGFIRQHATEMEIVLFPEGDLDIDTEEDYKKLLDDNRDID